MGGERLRAMVAGCGGIGGAYDGGGDDAGGSVLSHAAGYTRHPLFDLVACVDPDEGRREAFMRRWNVPGGFADVDDWRRSGTAVDVVSVCVPTASHAVLLGELLDAPLRAVLCEKPLTGNPRRSRELVDAYRARGVLLAVCHQRRHDPAMKALREALGARRWGAVQSATVHYDKGLRNNGSHALDLLHYLLGELRPLAAWESAPGPNADDPTLDAMLVAEGGARIHMVGGDFRRFELFEITLVAETAVLAIESGGFRIRTRRVVDDPVYAGYRVPGEAEQSETGLSRALLGAVDDIHAAITAGHALVGDAGEAVATELLCERLAGMAAETPVLGETGA